MESFPEEITTFLYNNVESIDQLEILRILGEDPKKEWDSVALARVVQAEPQIVQAHLAVMCARGLLVATSRDVCHTYRAGAYTPELEEMLCRLLRIYKGYPVTTIRKVYEQAKDPLRDVTNQARKRKEN